MTWQRPGGDLRGGSAFRPVHRVVALCILRTGLPQADHFPLRQSAKAVRMSTRRRVRLWDEAIFPAGNLIYEVEGPPELPFPEMLILEPPDPAIFESPLWYKPGDGVARYDGMGGYLLPVRREQLICVNRVHIPGERQAVRAAKIGMIITASG